MFADLPEKSRLSILPRLFRRASSDLFHFGVIFFLFLLGFSIAGVFLFGTDSRFESIGAALGSVTFVSLTADVDQTLATGSNEFWGRIYLIVYGVLCLFVLINMFISIVASAFEVVKIEMEREGASNLHTSLAKGLRSRFRFLRRMVRRFGSRNDKPNRGRGRLRGWARDGVVVSAGDVDGVGGVELQTRTTGGHGYAHGHDHDHDHFTRVVT